MTADIVTGCVSAMMSLIKRFMVHQKRAALCWKDKNLWGFSEKEENVF